MTTQTSRALLACGMLGTGALNSLFSKYQDNVCVADCQTDPKLFEQPVLQTLQMFVGETLCLFHTVHWLRLIAKLATDDASEASQVLQHAVEPVAIKDQPKDTPPEAQSGSLPAPLPPVLDPENVQSSPPMQELKGAQVFLLWLPAFFDICATTLMNVGLFFTPVSVYQMTRSALVLWVALLSVLYLKRRLNGAEIISLAIVCTGVFIVGLSSAFSRDTGKPIEVAKPIEPIQVAIGIGIILMAQVFTASQFVLEEKIMTKYTAEPLRVVGYEGIFGFLTTLLLMLVGYLAIGRTTAGHGGYFDVRSGLQQMFGIKPILFSSIAICMSIANFNSFGLAVTRSMSSTSRSVLDTCRPILIWVVSLALGWETFKPLQSVGFVVLVYGTFAFNGLVRLPGTKTEQPVTI